MTTQDQPSYDPNATSMSQPVGQGGSNQPARKGPGWAAYAVTVLALVLLAAVIIFVVQNDRPISIKFLNVRHDFDRSSVAFGAAALVGFLAGLLLGLIPWLSARRQLHHVRKSLR